MADIKRRDTTEQQLFWDHVERVSQKVEARHPKAERGVVRAGLSESVEIRASASAPQPDGSDNGSSG